MKQKKIKFNHIKILVFLVIVVAVAAFFVARHKNDGQGYRTISVVEISGNVSVVKNGVEYQAYSGMMLQEGHEIITGGGSYVRVVLDDDKYVKLESGSKVEFEKLGVVDSGKTRIKLERGSIVSEVVKPLNQDEEFVINTPNAVLSVRGTLFRVELNADKNGDIKADVMTYGGKVASQRVKPSGDIVEEEVLIDAGYKARINMTEEDTYYVVEDEKGELIIVEPVAPDSPGGSDNQGETIVLPTQPIKIEDIPDDDLVDMYFAVNNGHEMFVTAEEVKTKIEERDINLEEKKSVYVISAEVKQEKKDVIANDNKPIIREEETTATDDKITGSSPLIDGDGHECKEILAGLEQCHSKCKVCDKVMSTEHTFTEEVKVSPTCLDMGEMLYVCECGYRYTTDIPPTGHTESIGGTMEGHVVCSTCSQVLDSVHIFTDEQTLDPGCITLGEITHTCECGYVYVSEIAATGHSEVAGGSKEAHIVCETCDEILNSVHEYVDKVTQEVTCDTDGLTIHTCECGYEYTTVNPATKHTEVKTGTKDAHSKCDSCNEIISNTHTYSSKVTKEPTCTEKGITTHTCDCGYSYTTEIAEKGHVSVVGGTEEAHIKCNVCDEVLSSAHSYTSEVTSEPTCTVKGITVHTCDCGYSYTTEIAENGHVSIMGGLQEAHFVCDVCDEILSTSHSYTSEVTTEPTCTDEGVKTYTCDCGYVYTESIDANGHEEIDGGTQNCHTKCNVCGETLSASHNINETVQTAVTCKMDGKKLHFCDCGYEYTSVITATGHSKQGEQNVTICSSCGENLVMLNATNFPDSSLLTYLTRDNIDTYGDDMLDSDEVALITTLVVPDQVEDLTGIWTLSSLTELDFSNNTTCDNVVINSSTSSSMTITAYRDFDSIAINYSTTITSINLSGIGNVGSLELDGMTALESFTAEGTGITNLDVTECTNIEEISVSNSTSITEITADDCAKLASLNISGATSLTTLSVNNCTSLTSLDTSSNTNLAVLRANGATNISTFCGMTGTLDFSNNVNLTEIQFNDNMCFGAVELTSNDKLEKFIYNAMIATSIDLSGCTALEEIQIEGSSVTTLDFSACSELTTLKINNCTDLETLSISGCANMTYIDISNTQLTNLDLTNNVALQELDVSGLDIENLDFTNPCKGTLTTLKVNDTPLTSISPTEFTALTTLECKNTQMTTFSVNNSTLEYVDASGNTLLTQINAERTTYLKTLIIDNCTVLSNAFAFENSALETISAKNNPAMELIQPQSNPNLKLLDLTGSTLLTSNYSLENSGTDGGGLTVIVTGTSLTEGNFVGWDNSYMTLVKE